jgi:hypothetical protein
MTPYQERLGRLTVQWMPLVNPVAYRLSDGRVGGEVPAGGGPFGLVTTTGRRSGRPRTVPLLCFLDGDDQRRTDRRIPIVVLGPAPPDPA